MKINCTLYVDILNVIKSVFARFQKLGLSNSLQ